MGNINSASHDDDDSPHGTVTIPLSADFYSEESVNNQGLECLRFLNEVISDFDQVGGAGGRGWVCPDGWGVSMPRWVVQVGGGQYA